MERIVIYTAVFGDNVKIFSQPELPGVDFVCFSDRMHNVKGWKIIIAEKKFGNDNVRNNRYYKINPHLFFKDYDQSIYIDGNIILMRSPVKIFDKYLQNCNMAVFDHSQTKRDPRNCIYKEHIAIVELQAKTGSLKDNEEIMSTQIELFKKAGYPKNNGLIKGTVLIRKHNEADVILTMKKWWHFITNYSRRDQLSFNYVAWENDFKFCYLPGDLRRGNPWFYFASKHAKNSSFLKIKYYYNKIKNSLKTNSYK